MHDGSRLASLRARLAQRAAADVSDLDAYIAEKDPELWPGIRMAAHKMAGIAPMLGEAGLGELARGLDADTPPGRERLEHYRTELHRISIG